MESGRDFLEIVGTGQDREIKAPRSLHLEQAAAEGREVDTREGERDYAWFPWK